MVQKDAPSRRFVRDLYKHLFAVCYFIWFYLESDSVLWCLENLQHFNSYMVYLRKTPVGFVSRFCVKVKNKFIPYMYLVAFGMLTLAENFKQC